MKEDILEQAVDDWLLSQTGTFTKHNVKFRPDKLDQEFNSRDDSSHSDIDILAVQLDKESKIRVSTVTCKSWQNGFDPKNWLVLLTDDKGKKVSGREPWKFFRELKQRKWGKAFSQKVLEKTGTSDFIYYIAVTLLKGSDIENAIFNFENYEPFINNLKLNEDSKVVIKIIPFKDIFKEYEGRTAQTLEATELGRLIQIIKASGVELKK